MAIPLPEPRWKKLLKQPALYDIIIAAAACIGGIVSSVGHFAANKPEIGWMVIGVAGTIFAATIVKLLLQLQSKARQDSLHDLYGCLHLLHALLTQDVKEGENPKLRITVHVPSGEHNLIQVLDYVGDNRGGKTSGRKFPKLSGIMGEAFRRGDLCVASRENENNEQYIQELINDWNYTEEEARKRDSSSLSWMAIPLRNENTKRLEGVVYFDAVKKRFFDKQQVQSTALVACIGIARFVTQRYT